MKVVYILIFVVVLVAGYYFVAGPPSQVANDSNTEIVEEENNTHSDDTEHDDMEMMAEETDTKNTSTIGSDAGMEFPTPDNVAVLDAEVFNLDAFNFGYDITEIKVKKGDTVTINLTVSDGFHTRVVDEFDAATEKVREGSKTTVTFVADQAGTFEYYCSVGSHRAQGMVGKLIVE